MFIWRGWGILTMAIVVLIGGAGVVVAGALLKGAGDYSGLSIVIGLLAAAVVNWFVGRRLNRAPARKLVDQATGEQFIFRRSRDLFFIPMQWWSVLLVAAALVSLFMTLFGADPVLKPPTLPVVR